MNQKPEIILSFLLLFIANICYSSAQTKLIHTTEKDTTLNYEMFAKLAMNGETQKLDSFIRLGIKVDSAIFEGITPLMYASQEGHIEAMKLLIANGANVNAMPENKVAPFLSAIYAGKTKAAEILFQSGADVNVQDNSGMSPLLVALQKNDTILINLLLDAGANIYVQNNEGACAFHMVAVSGNVEVADLLLFNGLNINKKDNFGFTPLMIAEEFNQADIGFFLISNGADLNLRNEEGLTALSLAILNNDSYFSELLLMNGAEPNLLSEKAKDHWYYAKINGNKEIKNLLKRYDAEKNKAPVFNQTYLGFNLYGITNSFLSGLTFGVHEAKYNMSIQFSVLINPFLRSALFTKNEVIYQFWKRDLRIQSKVEKHFTVKRIQNKSLGLSLGLTPAYTFGYFRGTNYNPYDQFSIAPSVGTYFKTNQIEIKCGYEYRLPEVEFRNSSGLYLSLGFFIN